jgi:hypothetical protein
LPNHFNLVQIHFPHEGFQLLLLTYLEDDFGDLGPRVLGQMNDERGELETGFNDCLVLLNNLDFTNVIFVKITCQIEFEVGQILFKLRELVFI